MNNDIFTKAYLNLINESSYDIIGLENFNFPKYTYGKVNVGDELVYVYIGDRGESGRWAIKYWYVYSKKVTVTEVDGKTFKLDNGLTVVNGRSGKLTTTTRTEEYLDASYTDAYDTHTPLPTATRKVTDVDGEGVYPASFLLKYFVNKEKGYSLIGGGPSYRGLSFDKLKEMALKETSVQKQLTKQIGIKTEANEKDIERIKDLLNFDNVKFTAILNDYDLIDNKMFERAVNNGTFIKRDSLGLIRDDIGGHHIYGNYKGRLTGSGANAENTVKHLVRGELRKIKINSIRFTIHKENYICDYKKFEKMVKLIKDYDKCMRRIDAVNKVCDELEQKYPLLDDKNPEYYNAAIDLIKEQNTDKKILKFKEVCEKELPRFSKEYFANMKYNIYNDNNLSSVRKKFIEILQKRAEELKQDRERLQ